MVIIEVFELIALATSAAALVAVVVQPKGWPLCVAIWVTAAAQWFYLPLRNVFFPLGPGAGPMDGAAEYICISMAAGIGNVILACMLPAVFLIGKGGSSPADGEIETTSSDAIKRIDRP